MSEFLRRLRLLFSRESLEREIEEEMRIHLEMHAEERSRKPAWTYLVKGQREAA
jgi:hypothetical protein